MTEISPLNGRSWEAISNKDTATPVAKIPIAWRDSSDKAGDAVDHFAKAEAS